MTTENNTTPSPEEQFRTALRLVRSEMGVIVKKHNNEFGGFKFTNLPAMLESVQPVLDKHELTAHFNGGAPIEVAGRPWQPVSLTLEGFGMEREFVQYFAWGAGGEADKKPKPKMDATQTTGSLISYGCKYLLMMALALRVQVDDPDANSGSPEARAKPPAGSSSSAAPASSAPSGNGECAPKCHECGKEMVRRKSGEKAKNPGRVYWSCPDKKFGDKTNRHSFVFADNLVMVGADGSWEEGMQ